MCPTPTAALRCRRRRRLNSFSPVPAPSRQRPSLAARSKDSWDLTHGARQLVQHTLASITMRIPLAGSMPALPDVFFPFDTKR